MSALSVGRRRREMIEMLISHDGVSQEAAAKTFRRSDIRWGLDRQYIATRRYRTWDEFYATEAGRKAVA